MFSFLVNAEGGLTNRRICGVYRSGNRSVRRGASLCGKSLGEKEDGDKAAGVLRNGSGAGVYHILHQDLQHAVGRAA